MPATTSTTLDGARVVATLEALHSRIVERFPDSSLSRVCADLVKISRKTEADAATLSRPYVGLRVTVALVIAAAAALTVQAFRATRVEEIAGAAVVDLAQGMDAAVNLALLAGAAAWFLLTLETRLKRRKVHAALSELRGVAHVIDMHQLTKDPTAIAGARPTTASPARDLSEFELARYLDYCTEMLALIAKLAELYQRAHSDAEIGSAVNEVESLTSDLGRKIWQKITIIGQLAGR